MKKNEDFRKDVYDAIEWEPLFTIPETRINRKPGKSLKRFIYLAGFVAIGLCINACMAGYVATEPVYMEVARPPRPGQAYIWIDGGWAWSRQSHNYVQKRGYWEKPNQRQTYVPGHWESTPKGHYWVPAHKQKQSRREDNRNR